MSIVGGGIIPNSPLLLPKLSVVAQKQVSRTREAISRLCHEMYALQPSIIIVISSSRDDLPVSCLLQAPSLNYSFAEWGDVVTEGKVNIATGFTHSLKERAETNYPILLKSVNKLPTDFAIPSVLLDKFFPQVPFVYLQLAKNISVDDLSRLSIMLAEQCNTSSERIILLATGTLAEQREKSSSEAAVFDKYFKTSLSPLSLTSLINLDAGLRQRTRETIWSPTILALMVLADRVDDHEILSYESPSRVGYLVALMKLK